MPLLKMHKSSLTLVSKFKYVYKKDEQGLVHLATYFLLGSATLFILLVSIISYRTWLLKQQHTLETEVAHLQQENRAILKRMPTQGMTEKTAVLNIQSMIGYLSAQHLNVESVTSVENNHQRLWKAEGQLTKQDLTPFIHQLDTDSSSLNLTDIRIEQNEEKPDQLKLSLSGYLK